MRYMDLFPADKCGQIEQRIGVEMDLVHTLGTPTAVTLNKLMFVHQFLITNLLIINCIVIEDTMK